MNNVKIIVTGAAGRMGKKIISAISNTPNASLAGALELSNNPNIGKDAGECAGVENMNCMISDSLEKMDLSGCILIDFTQAQATIKNLEIISKNGAKAVIGTTGFSSKELEEIKSISKNAPIVLASNMSVGMNLLFKLVKDTAKTLGLDYNVEIIEAHHNLKKDAPSGSAKTLAEYAANGLDLNIEETGVYGRQGITGERPKKEIGVHAVRGGDIVGDHTVLFAGPGERLELKHQAHSRDTFASGAVRAALWLSKKEAGLYNMHDVLEIK